LTNTEKPLFKSHEQINSVFVENEHLRCLREATAELPLGYMQIDPHQAAFIAFLAGAIKATKVLELGTFTGYFALSLALALPEEGRLITCDITTQWKTIARHHWDAARVSRKIDFRLRSASHVLNTLIAKGGSGTFDLVFIDADKDNQDEYFEKSLKLLSPNGLLLIDNIFMGKASIGSKQEDVKFSKDQIIKVRNLVNRIRNDKRVDMNILPIADGLALIRKL
jgi:O-methyltransferase